MKVIKESVNLTEGSVTYPHVLRNRGWEIVEDESQFTNELKKKKEYQTILWDNLVWLLLIRLFVSLF